MPEPTDYRLSDYDFMQACAIQAKYPFYVLLAAACLHADNSNLARIEAMFPGVVASCRELYNKPLFPVSGLDIGSDNNVTFIEGKKE